MYKCDWVGTVHKNHWLCTRCGYNQWGNYPPDDCMYEESKEQLKDFLDRERHKLYEDNYET